MFVYDGAPGLWNKCWTCPNQHFKDCLLHTEQDGDIFCDIWRVRLWVFRLEKLCILHYINLVVTAVLDHKRDAWQMYVLWFNFYFLFLYDAIDINYEQLQVFSFGFQNSNDLWKFSVLCFRSGYLEIGYGSEYLDMGCSWVLQFEHCIYTIEFVS